LHSPCRPSWGSRAVRNSSLPRPGAPAATASHPRTLATTLSCLRRQASRTIRGRSRLPGSIWTPACAGVTASLPRPCAPAATVSYPCTSATTVSHPRSPVTTVSCLRRQASSTICGRSRLPGLIWTPACAGVTKSLPRPCAPAATVSYPCTSATTVSHPRSPVTTLSCLRRRASRTIRGRSRLPGSFWTPACAGVPSSLSWPQPLSTSDTTRRPAPCGMQHELLP